MTDLAGKTVVISGAGSGIGRALAISAARKGANLAICDVNGEALAATSAEVSGRVYKEVVDVAKLDQWEGFAARVDKEFDGADILINNAGVSLSEMVVRMELADFQWVMNINFWGVVYGVSAFMPQLMSKKEAHIVNISSVFGIIAVPSQAAYNASKFAVKGYTEALRQELKGGHIKVTCVHPGGIKTNIVRNGKHYTAGTKEPVKDVEKLARNFDKIAMTSPDKAAEVIIKGIETNSKRVLVGPDAKVIDLIQRFLPTSYDVVMGKLMKIG